MTTKSSSVNPSIFMDWKGELFVGVKSKTGNAPTDVVSVETGENVPQEDVKELEGEEIIDYMSENIFPDLMSDNEKGFENIPKELLQDSAVMQEIELAKSATVETLRDSMFLDLQMTEEEAEAYWNTLKENETELMNASDEELNNDSKFFGRWFRRIFSRTDRSLKYISKYDTKKYNYRRQGGWCGPWACGYIVYVNQGVDKYDFFENCAGTFGELGIGNLLLRLVGRPLTPVEMSWSMPIASKGRIWINPMLCFADLYAYDQIKHYGRPALRLCSSGGGLHWTLAYGTKQTGSWFWRNYYFLQIDNGAKVGIPNSMTNSANYTKVDWWNPWLMVWD